MRFIGCFDQLNVHEDAVAALLHTSFQDVGDTKLVGDFGQVFRDAFVILRGCPRNNFFQIGDLG